MFHPCVHTPAPHITHMGGDDVVGLRVSGKISPHESTRSYRVTHTGGGLVKRADLPAGRDVFERASKLSV